VPYLVRCASFNGAALFRARRPCADQFPSASISEPSMGPRSFERGDCRRVLPAQQEPCPFNGAALFRAWRQQYPPRADQTLPRFNGAALFRARRLGIRKPNFNILSQLQWGRALSSAETCSQCRPCRSDWSRFNGAALFRARRPADVTAPENGKRCFNGAALFRARRRSLRADGRQEYQPFNGAALFRARRRVGNAPKKCPLKTLQWGRALSSAETARTGEACARQVPPSMGPRSFERGDGHPAGRERRCALHLQWGRALSSAETLCSPPEPLPWRPPFNGAALFRARRPACSGYIRGAAGALQWGRALSSAEPRYAVLGAAVAGAAFNGAALFRARRRAQLPSCWALLFPSMGPRSFERGDHPFKGLPLSGREALQWGRALSSAETPVRLWYRSCIILLQWGRALSSAETLR